MTMKIGNAAIAGGAMLAAFALAGAAQAAPVKLAAKLAGAGGSGSFSGEFDFDTGDVCYVLEAKLASKFTAAHVHAGGEGENGAPVFALDLTGADQDLCIAIEPDAMKPILADPAKFYVNVHTSAAPAGAIRGQLAKAGG